MEQKGKFLITIDAGYQLHFRQTVDGLLEPLTTNSDYEDVESYVRNYDRDTGIVSVRTKLITNDNITVDTSGCFQEQPIYDRLNGQWYPGSYNDEPRLEYDANGIMEDLKEVLKKMEPIGQVSIHFDSVQTDDYETKLDDEYVGCL